MVAISHQLLVREFEGPESAFIKADAGLHPSAVADQTGLAQAHNRAACLVANFYVETTG